MSRAQGRRRWALLGTAVALVTVGGIEVARRVAVRPSSAAPKAHRAPRILPLPIERFSQASPISMAAYLTQPADHGFALAHAATAMGIPLLVTRDLEKALRQPMVVIVGAMSGQQMTPAVEKRLRAYVAAGGTLVMDVPEARTALNLVGATAVVPARTRCSLTFDRSTGDLGLRRLGAPEARTIRIGNPRKRRAIGSLAFRLRPDGDSKVLARFDDGSPAVLRRSIGRGRVYALGASFQDLILRPQLNRDMEAQRWFDNHFEPSADVPQILLRDWYAHWVPGAITLHPIPKGQAGALIMTHDVDFVRSVPNMLPFAQAEAARGVRATYFVQTKTVHDYQDVAFFNEQARRMIAQVDKMGGEIASHTVAHAYDFWKFPVGTGREEPETYQPRVVSGGKTDRDGKTEGGSVYGEIRVSQALLEETIGKPIEAFRPGYLHTHPEQWRALVENGYRFASSYTANDVMRMFPYAAMDQAGYERESGITEFPILFADSVAPMARYIPQFKRVLDRVAEFHGVAVALIHTDVVADKLPTGLALLDHVRGRFWVGTLGDFGRFWEERAQVTVSATAGPGTRTVRVRAPKGIDGLTLEFGRPIRLLRATGTAAHRSSDGRTVTLKEITAETAVTLAVQ